jgi:hypothetical protein
MWLDVDDTWLIGLRYDNNTVLEWYHWTPRRACPLLIIQDGKAILKLG